MYKHISIILFDPDSIPSDNLDKNFEEKLLTTRLHPKAVIYLLKITPKENEKYTVWLFDNPGDATTNTKSKIATQFDFKNGQSLKACFDFLYNRHPDITDEQMAIQENRWYFICIGHGYGYTLFDYDNNSNQIPEKDDGILYTSELVNCFGEKYFRLCIFNTCNFTLFDNSYLVYKKIKFLIGTENYTSVRFFDIAYYINLLNNRISNNINSFEFSRNVLTSIRLEIERNNNEALKGSTIFLFNLEPNRLENFFSSFNNLSLYLSNHFSDSFYAQLWEGGTGIDYNFIDLKNCCDRILLLKPDDDFIVQRCNEIFEGLVALKCKKELNSDEKLQGVSIYLPNLFFGEDWHYKRFKQKFPDLFNKLNWYQFIEEALKASMKRSLSQTISWTKIVLKRYTKTFFNR